MPAANVLHQRMPHDDDPGATVLLEPAHRFEPRLQPAVIALDSIVGIPVGAVPRRREQLPQHRRIHRRLIGGDLHRRDLGRADRPLEESTKNSVTLRLLAHAEQHWPQLSSVEVTYRGAFAYVTGVLAEGEQVPLCRLRYGGSAHSFGFAIYSAAHDRYQEAALLTGLGAGSPQDALDTACTIHLAGIGR